MRYAIGATHFITQEQRIVCRNAFARFYLREDPEVHIVELERDHAEGLIDMIHRGVIVLNDAGTNKPADPDDWTFVVLSTASSREGGRRA